MGFTLGAFSAALVGAVGGGGQTGIIARSIRTITFSIITVTADTDIDMAPPGLTIPAIGKESTIRIVRSINATAEFQSARGGSSFSRFGGQSYASRQYNTAPRANAAQGGGWSHFGQAGPTSQGAQRSYRSTPTYSGSSAYRASRSYSGSYGGNRTVPSYRFSPSNGNSSAYRSSPSYSGSYGGNRTVPSYRFSPSYGNSSAYRASPSYSGSYGGNRTVPSYQSIPSYAGGGGYQSTRSFSGGGSIRSGGGFHGGRGR